jgi:hypothetical protein
MEAIMTSAEKRRIEREHTGETLANERRPEIGFLMFTIVIFAGLVTFSGSLSFDVAGAPNLATPISQVSGHTHPDAIAAGSPRSRTNAAPANQQQSEPAPPSS